MDKPDGIIAFKGARIITMKGDEVIENGTIIVQNNKIIAVGKADAVEIPKKSAAFEDRDKKSFLFINEVLLI